MKPAWRPSCPPECTPPRPPPGSRGPGDCVLSSALGGPESRDFPRRRAVRCTTRATPAATSTFRGGNASSSLRGQSPERSSTSVRRRMRAGDVPGDADRLRSRDLPRRRAERRTTRATPTETSTFRGGNASSTSASLRGRALERSSISVRRRMRAADASGDADQLRSSPSPLSIGSGADRDATSTARPRSVKRSETGGSEDASLPEPGRMEG